MDFILRHSYSKNQHGDNRKPKISKAKHWPRGDNSCNNIGFIARIYIWVHMELQGT